MSLAEIFQQTLYIVGFNCVALESKQFEEIALLDNNIYSCFILPPFKIIIRLAFLTSSLTTPLIQNFEKNITSFVMTYFINISSP